MNYDDGFWYIPPQRPDFEWTGLEKEICIVRDLVLEHIAKKDKALYPAEDFLPALRRKWAERFEA